MIQPDTQPVLCQSCAMPLDTEHADLIAQNADGGPAEYCTYCFADGQFRQPDLTVAQVVEIGVPYVVPFTGDEVSARQYLNALVPTLKRWAPAAA